MISDPSSSRRMFSAAAACPGCGRSAWRSSASVRPVPRSPSVLIAAAMSAVLASSSRSASASTSVPSIPSVPLMSARPSFSSSTTGSMPAAASASAAGTRAPVESMTSPSPISASAHAASGARSPEQPSDPYSCTTGVMPAFSSAAYACGGRGPDARAPRAQRLQPQQHHRAHDLGLDQRARYPPRASGRASAAAARGARARCTSSPAHRSPCSRRTPAPPKRRARRRTRACARSRRGTSPRSRRARRRGQRRQRRPWLGELSPRTTFGSAVTHAASRFGAGAPRGVG